MDKAQPRSSLTTECKYLFLSYSIVNNHPRTSNQNTTSQQLLSSAGSKPSNIQVTTYPQRPMRKANNSRAKEDGDSLPNGDLKFLEGRLFNFHDCSESFSEQNNGNLIKNCIDSKYPSHSPWIPLMTVSYIFLDEDGRNQIGEFEGLLDQSEQDPNSLIENNNAMFKYSSNKNGGFFPAHP